jgi:hypothetical protein
MDLGPRVRRTGPHTIVVSRVGLVLRGIACGPVQNAPRSDCYGGVVDELSNKVWQALDLLAKKHPTDEGVRLALELRDRLKAHYERLRELQVQSTEDNPKPS